MPRFIFITGGVASSLGKGVAAASITALLQARGYSVSVRKIDPYFNVDPGTMSPYQHGEVFVTADGGETDLDLGHYERFSGIASSRHDSISMGQVYSRLIAKERAGGYLGATVQVIPHVTDLIKGFIRRDAEKFDFIICEIGGTVGDIEGLPCFEAIRQIGYETGQGTVAYVHLGLIPYVKAADELKTKPIQHSVKELRSTGIHPDILLCRSERNLSAEIIGKIGLLCNVPPRRVIPALDLSSIYLAPMSYHRSGLDAAILDCFSLSEEAQPAVLDQWQRIEAEIAKEEKPVVKIGIFGKYIDLRDAYKSIIESVFHCQINAPFVFKLEWLATDNLEECDQQDLAALFADLSGIIVPGGFGERGIEGKIAVIKYARENGIPTFGICLGMQLLVIEYARHVLGITAAGSTEFSEDCVPLIDLLTGQRRGDNAGGDSEGDLGGTMRLGSHPCSIKTGTLLQQIYGAEQVVERHRHRYGVNDLYSNELEKCGMIIASRCESDGVIEAVEVAGHPWFIGVQYHPEFESRPFAPHQLFASFLQTAALHGQ